MQRLFVKGSSISRSSTTQQRAVAQRPMTVGKSVCVVQVNLLELVTDASDEILHSRNPVEQLA
jgi:hypothetical protein